MGQQQLLLIVLGVIIVGIAVVVGINLFNANAEESAIDTVVSEATNICAMGLQHFKKPTALGGGGNSFDGSAAAAGVNFEDVVPDRLTDTEFTLHGVAADALLLTVTSSHDGYDFEVVCTVNDLGVYTTTVDRAPVVVP